MMCGKPPFMGNDKEEVTKCITTEALTFKGETWDNVSKEAKDFLTKGLKKDPRERPDSYSMLQHTWLSSMAEE